MHPIAIFTYAAAGSVAVEVIAWARAYDELPHEMPARYRMWTFWFSRLTLAILAGLLALAYEINKPLLAINVGASAPLLYRALARGLN